jgi:hypothetical protein
VRARITIALFSRAAAGCAAVEPPSTRIDPERLEYVSQVRNRIATTIL